MERIAIIGGSGLSELDGLKQVTTQSVTTPYGPPSATITKGKLHGKTIFFLPRHGTDHTLAPHKINYRANIHALSQFEVSAIIAVAAVGGIAQDCVPGMLCVPDQIIDYTYGREQSFFSENFSAVQHIDFTKPYDEQLRHSLIQTAASLRIPLIEHGVYGATQGPRLETAAEIRRMARDGCTLVGMTGMPEASLAREMAIPYTTLALVANRAAGLSATPLTMTDIQRTLATGMQHVKAIVSALIA